MWNAFIFFVGFYSALLVHELGHFFAARWYDVKVLIVAVGLGPEIMGATDKLGTRWKLCWLPFGAYCQFGSQFSDHNNLSPELSEKTTVQQSVIFLAGPVFSFLYAAALLLLTNIRPGHNGTLALSEVPLLILAVFSLLVGVFNLIPVPPLDGGRLLQLWMPRRSFARRREKQENAKP